jgi:short subunit dehydrogenase-like uncharacterized protein
MPEFDLVVYGATGFTGSLVCDHLATTYGSELRWAMAGRDPDKLAAVHSRSGAVDAVPTLVVDLAKREEVEAMAARTRAVITTAGPFATMGEPLVAACARSGTAYADLTGDAAWVRRMIDAHETKARSSGARMIFSAGFDSVPSDLGVWFLQSLAVQRQGRPLNRVKCRVQRISGSLSGGSIASARASAAIAADNREDRALLVDPFALVPGFSGPTQPVATKAEFDADVGSWVAPFIMSGINVKTVHRSNALQGQPYGADFIYDEMIMYREVADEESAQAAAEADQWSNRGLIAQSTLQPGDGPDAEAQASGGYEFLFTGQLEDGTRLEAVLTGVGDPGYRSTSRLIAETALCLLDDGGAVPGGMWTAVSALGDAPRQRLEAKAGLTIVERSALR